MHTMIVAIAIALSSPAPKTHTYTMTIGHITVVPNAPAWTCKAPRESLVGGTVRECR